MTITITKAKLAVAILVAALLVPAVAFAAHQTGHANFFDDVPDEAFYADAATWAKDNDITTGSPAGSRTFKPLDGVTRGENITFAKRYDDNIVQPALATLTSDVADNAAAIAALPPGPAVHTARELDGSYQNLPQNTATELGRLTVPAGTWLFTARVLVNNNSASNMELDCVLAAGGDEDNVEDYLTVGADDDRELVNLVFPETLASSGDVVLTCTSDVASANAGRVVITAVELGSVTETVINAG